MLFQTESGTVVKKTPIAPVMCNGFFQKGVAQGKSAATPLSFEVQGAKDLGFQMRYCMSLHS